MARKRITITIQKDLLDILDTYVDGITIRNRSHAIESILRERLNPPITKAVILAADEGIKFRPFTYEMPKSMLPIKGRPLLEHIINKLRSDDIRDIYISVGYLNEKIKSYFGDGSKFGVKITYYTQNRKDLGTAGALKNFCKYFNQKESFFLVYGDVLADVSYKDIAKFYYLHKNAIGVVCLTTTKKPELWGVVKLKGHKIVEFIEKPIKLSKSAESHLISTGIYLFSHKIFSYISGNKKISLEKDVLSKAVKENTLIGYVLEGNWYDISTPKIYARVLKEWK